MQETKWIWINRNFVKWKNAKIHVLSHALHYGSAAFEGIRAYKTSKGTAIFRLREHVSRLLKSFSIFKIASPYKQEEIEKAILETLRKNNLEEAYIRPILYFGYGEMGLRNLDKCKIDLAIATWTWPKYLSGDTIKVKLSKIRRISPESLITDAKISGHYVNSILASLEAKEAGFDEALLLDSEGNISEGPGENIFLVFNDKIKTPLLKGQILPGITRDSVIKIAKDFGYEVKEVDLTLDNLKNASEVFMTGTAAEVTGISQIDDEIIGDGKIGKVTSKLRKEFLNAVYGRSKKYEKWLSFV